eukprot:TRINITY_DN12056_c0_g2_i2.p1 TRINITY_DN12056_c0_g2~~TRINITY_DN12056_c0_g2_i2.p1  ORF type:complete len:275 (+),score=60.47 TRINITY_DN12056_c0_g2_i2:815-1639(+)
MEQFEVLDKALAEFACTGPPHSQEQLVLIGGKISRYTLALIDSVIVTREVVDRVYGYFLNIVRISLQFLMNKVEMPHNLSLALHACFYGRRGRFFDTFGVSEDDPPYVRGPYAARNAHVVPLENETFLDDSIYVLNLVNEFGEGGGFERLGSLIEDEKTSEVAVIDFVLVIKAAWKFFPPEFESVYIGKVATLLKARLARLLKEAQFSDASVLQGGMQYLKNKHDIVESVYQELLKEHVCVELPTDVWTTVGQFVGNEACGRQTYFDNSTHKII